MNFKKALDTNPVLLATINKLREKQFEIQTNQLAGKTPNSDLLREMEESYQTLMNEPVASQYLQAEMRFSLMINDVYKILNEATGFNDFFNKIKSLSLFIIILYKVVNCYANYNSK